MNQEKISKYIVGFLVIFTLLFGLFAYIAISYGNKQYVKDTERVTKLVEALENNTTNIKQNITLEEALKLVSDDSELSSVKKAERTRRTGRTGKTEKIERGSREKI